MKLALTAPVSEIKANADKLSSMIFGFMLLGMVTSVVRGIIISSSIANPIKKITEVIKQTSQLNFHKNDHMDKSASATMIVNNINAIQNNASDIRDMSEREQSEAQQVMSRARQLRDDTAASSDKAMQIFLHLMPILRRLEPEKREEVLQL